MDRNTRMQARVAHILGQERNGSGSAGTAVSENYGNRNAGPSSSARFKRGGIVGATAGVDGAKVETAHGQGSAQVWRFLHAEAQHGRHHR